MLQSKTGSILCAGTGFGITGAGVFSMQSDKTIVGRLVQYFCYL